MGRVDERLVDVAARRADPHGVVADPVEDRRVQWLPTGHEEQDEWQLGTQRVDELQALGAEGLDDHGSLAGGGGVVRRRPDLVEHVEQRLLHARLGLG